VELSRLEEDLIGDLAQDDHALYEVFFFVRHHAGDEPDERTILPLGRVLLDSWIQRGWLAIAPNPSETARIDQVAQIIPLVDSLGETATQYFVGAPWLRLGKKAYEDLPWLRADDRNESPR
jgi:hypothetical protein